MAAGAPLTEPLSSGSFLIVKMFSEVILFPPVNPNEPEGEVVKEWLPIILFTEVGLAGFKAPGTSVLPAATASAHVQQYALF